MSMNNKIFKIFIAFFLVIAAFTFNRNLNVYAATTNCNGYTTKDLCILNPKCRWISGSCQAQNVAQEPCNDNNIRKVLKTFGYALLIAKFVIPLLIIGFGTMDFYKAITDKDDKIIGKQIKKFGVRIIAGLVVFFIPDFIYATFSLSDKFNIIDTSDYKTCAACILDPTDDTVCLVK